MGHYGAMYDEKSITVYSVKNLLTRDFVLAFCAFFCFASAFHTLTPTLPIFLAGLGSSKREIGILVGTIGISSLFFRFVVGKILVRYPERLVLIWGITVFAFSFLALIVFRPFWPFFILRFLQGIAFACMDTAIIAYVIRIMPVQHRTRVINYFMLAPPLASGVATAASVFILNECGFNTVLLTAAGLCACAFYLMWKLKRQENVMTVPVSHVKNRPFFERKILAPAIVSFLCVFAWGGLTAFFPLYAVQCGVRNPGLFYSAIAVMLVLSRLMAGRIFDIYEKEKIIVVSILIMIMVLVLLAFSKTLPMFILVGFLWGIGFGLLFPVVMAYSLEYAGSSDGITIATYQASMDLGIALGPTVAGIILPFTGYRVMFLFQGLVCLISLIYFQFYLRNRCNAASKV
jgi:MFS family permease